MSQHQYSPWRRLFSSRLFVLIALPLAIVASFGYARAFYQGYKIKQEIKALQAEVATLQRKKIESLDILNYVRGDEFVEEKARTELNLKRPGERVLVATNQAAADKAADEIKIAPLQIIGNPIKWWYYFVHRQPR